MKRYDVLVLLCGLLLLGSGCNFFTGHAGGSYLVDGRFVLISYGYRFDKVTYVVVESWPESSTPDERNRDHRTVFTGYWEQSVRLPDGRLTPVKANTLYFFDQDRLVSFPIDMTEEQLNALRPEALKSYGEILAFFRRFERRN
jgi:hypothetical protein